MHFLGLAGMPRRIPDYPSIYAFWNFVCSVGSLLSVLSIFIFFILLYLLFDSSFYKVHRTYLADISERFFFLSFFLFFWKIATFFLWVTWRVIFLNFVFFQLIFLFFYLVLFLNQQLLMFWLIPKFLQILFHLWKSIFSMTRFQMPVAFIVNL